MFLENAKKNYNYQPVITDTMKIKKCSDIFPTTAADFQNTKTQKLCRYSLILTDPALVKEKYQSKQDDSHSHSCSNHRYHLICIKRGGH